MVDAEKRKIWRQIQKTKKLQYTGKIIFWSGWIIWLLETVTYLIIDGWHTGSEAGKTEKIFDYISGILMISGLCLLLKAMSDFNKIFIDALEEEVENHGDWF